MVCSIVNPHCKKHERHVVLSFYRVRESITAKIVKYLFIDGTNNLADVLTKYWARHDIWPTLKPIFWTGDTMKCLNNNSLIFEDRE